VESRRAVEALDDIPTLLQRRSCCREFLKSKHQAITQLEDEADWQVTQIRDIQRRLCELGYTGD